MLYEVITGNLAQRGALYFYERDLGGAGSWGEAQKLFSSTSLGAPDNIGQSLSHRRSVPSRYSPSQ